MPEHNTLTGADLHEPKGVAAATIDQVYIADGAGSGTWTTWPIGWGFYEDGSAGQTINSTPSKISIDGAGTSSESAYLPRDIRGTDELWDTSTDFITPIAVGDVYNLRLTLPITAKSGSPSLLSLAIDIGGAAGITIPIVERDISTDNTAPFNLNAAFPLFIGATALSNGIQIFASTDTGSVDIAGQEILLVRQFAEI